MRKLTLPTRTGKTEGSSGAGGSTSPVRLAGGPCVAEGVQMGTMMALRAHVRGGPEQLVYERAPAPTAAPGEALIAVNAAAITFAELSWELEWTTREGRDRTPVIPSHELSGVVAGLGPGVAGLVPGDEVIGLVDFDRDGAAAEYVAVPVANLALKPKSLSYAAAAALPLGALTAWQALKDQAVLRPGERVLVQGGAGGVGSFAVQLAASIGGRVTGTGRGADREYVRALGAEQYVSVDSEPPGQPGGGYDVVIDTVGGSVLDASYSLLREGGRLVTLGAPADPKRAARHKLRAIFFVVTPDAHQMALLAAMAEEGKIRAVVGQTFPLAEGRKAFESRRGARPPGKTVLTVR